LSDRLNSGNALAKADEDADLANAASVRITTYPYCSYQFITRTT